MPLSSRMPRKEWIIPLTPAVWIEIERITVAGRNVGFRVVMLAEIEARTHCVARYDTAHGTPHQDILGLRGGTLAKHWFFESSREEVFQYAIRDLQSHAEEYIRFFREN